MKRSIILVFFTFPMLLSYLSIEPFIANAGENDCILEASVDVIEEVWDADKKGNKGHRIWKGLIKQGEKKPIKSRHGQIRYAQTKVINENEPLSGDISRA
jgi:hypothetical protein